MALLGLSEAWMVSLRPLSPVMLRKPHCCSLSKRFSSSHHDKRVDTSRSISFPNRRGAREGVHWVCMKRKMEAFGDGDEDRGFPTGMVFLCLPSGVVYVQEGFL